MKVFSFCILIVLVLISQTSLANKTDALNDQIESSVWSSLSKTEVETISNQSLARKGDPDALLMLAILASGDIRNRSAYNKIKEKVHHFVNRIRPTINAEKKDWNKGLKLFLAMHDAFFLNSSSGKDLEGYLYDQSRFSTIFQNKTYNCISSSILYLILARYFDLHVEGVILPSHSFVQLITRDGQIVEIETTSKTGYGLRHSQEFYNKNASQWSLYRNLATMTYKDYLNREIVSAYNIIIDNMNHQHTSPEYLAAVDRYRLYELRAYLSPNHPEAQLFRLYVINNELIRLRENNNDKKTLELIQIAEKIIAEHYETKLKSKKKIDAKLQKIIRFVFTSKAEISLQKMDHKSAINSFKNALKWSRNTPEKQQIQENIAISWLNYGNIFFNKKDYLSAVQFYDKAYLKNISSKLKLKIDNNIGASYWNLAVPYLNKGDSYTAYEQLKKCQIKYPKIKECHEKLDTICQSYSLPGC